jgi:regulator of ribonuclease activity A
MSYLTTDLCDAHEALIRVVEPMFTSFGGNSTFHGQIATLRVDDDNSFVRKALESPGSGRVLVIDGGGSVRRALVGDQLASLAIKNNWAGIVVNGCVRDSVAIATMNIGVFAIDTHPMKTLKKNLGEADIVVSFGGVDFIPGEWIYADDDGVIVSAKPIHTL